jgi:membrane peptidoglycan carboxypeptidase
LELVTGYSTLARGGVYVEPTSIKRIEDSRGNPVPMNTPVRKRVFDQDHVAALVDILIDVVEKGTGKNAILPDRVVAGKTGTTDQMRDIWFMGFTPDVVAGVWADAQPATALAAATAHTRRIMIQPPCQTPLASYRRETSVSDDLFVNSGCPG